MSDKITRDAYSARLLAFIADTIAASGRTDADSRECLGKLIATWGHDGLFDANGSLDMRRAAVALAGVMPPVRGTDAPTVENGYGYGEAFANLHPLERLKIQTRFEYDAALAAQEAKRVADRDQLTASLPPDWSTYTDGMKTFWLARYTETKRLADEATAAAAKVDQGAIAKRKADFAREAAQ